MKDRNASRKIQFTNQTFLVLKIVIVSFVAVILCVVAAWSWFNNNRTADASGIEMSMSSGKNLLLSLDNGASYHTTIDLLSDDFQQYISSSNKIKDNLTMLDITSDGKTFLRPTFMQEDGHRLPDTTGIWTTANPNRAYISQTVKFRTNFPADIYMAQGTKVDTHCQTVLESELIGTDCGNKSEFGSYSMDVIVGALRISAIDSNNNRCFTMIPRTDVELRTIRNNIVVRVDDNVSDDVYNHTYYGSDYLNTSEPKSLDDGTLIYEFTAADNAKPTDTTTKIAQTTMVEEGVYEGVATINIWLEGTDPEAHRYFSGGKFSINLDFVAFEN